MAENMTIDQDVTNGTQETNIQFNPIKEDKSDRKVLRAEEIPNILMSTNICENEETKHNDDVQNNLGSPNISFMKMNSSTPKKTGDLLNNSDNTNDNNKVDGHSVSNKNMFSLTLKELKDLLKSPSSKKTERLQSDSVVPANENLEKINKSNDYKQLCDTMQSELYNSQHLSLVFEDEDLLHDDLLSTAINVEETKASDILLSSISGDNTLEYNDECLTDLKEDPPTDPLFISDREKKDNIAFMDLDMKPLSQRRLSHMHKEVNYNHDVKKPKKELNSDEKRILKELENIREKEELPLSTIQQLKSLRIQLVHKIPPQHEIGTGTHTISRKDKCVFQNYGPLRKGSYSLSEDKIIMQNWNMFCKLHNWDSENIEPFLNLRHNGKYYIHNLKERQKFVQFLANGLVWRTLYSVYSRFKVLYCNKITSVRYTAKEDKKILTYIRNKCLDKRSTKYIELAKLLGRTRRSVSIRYKYLKNVSQNKLSGKVKWTLPLIKKFIKTLLSVTNSDDVKELKYITLPMPVWQKMEEKLSIDWNVLKIFWQHQLHMQLFSTNPIYLDNIKIQLIEYIYKKGISNTREIIWPNVAQYFDGATGVFLCKIFFYLVQECNVKDTDFSNVIDYLYHKKIPEIKDALTDKFLPRIRYKDGKIDVLHLEDDTNTVHYGADYNTDDV